MRQSSFRRVARPMAAIAALTISLAACSGDDAGGTGTTVEAGETAGVRVVSPAAASELLAASPAPTLIDVRTPGEYAEGHLAGAVLIDINAADFQDRIAELDRDASYVIYCRSGNRSAAARDVMSDLGFADVADIDGGILSWTQAGLPVTTA